MANYGQLLAIFYFELFNLKLDIKLSIQIYGFESSRA